MILFKRLQILVLLCFQYLISRVLCDDTILSEKGNAYQIWNMTEDFGRHFNVKHWVFHSSIYKNKNFVVDRIYLIAMKERENTGYFNFVNPPHESIAGNLPPLRKVTLHLFAQTNWKELNHSINQDLDQKSIVMEETNIEQEISSNIWLIQMPADSSEKQMKEFLDNNTFV